MPVKSLHSSVHRWPTRRSVVSALEAWARETGAASRDIRRIGYFGSYAREESGVGSDLDVVIEVRHSALPFGRRAAQWDTTGLPVPVDLLVYTTEELGALQSPRMRRTLSEETRWVYADESP